jgi:hypothetical protein
LPSETADISTIVRAQLELLAKETSKRIEFLLQVEREPFTENKHSFRDYRRKFLAYYKGLYHSNLNNYFIDRLRQSRYSSSEFNSALNMIISNLAFIGIHNVNPLDLAVLKPSEPEDVEDALRIMADVRGYFQGT